MTQRLLGFFCTGFIVANESMKKSVSRIFQTSLSCRDSQISSIIYNITALMSVSAVPNQ
jgi:hypothetical protein